MSRLRPAPAALLLAIAVSLAGAAVAGAQREEFGGELTIDGAGPFAGTLGTSCFEGSATSGCSDAPWLTPRSGPYVRASAEMTFRLSDGSEITGWGAGYGDASEPEPDVQHLDGDDDSGVTQFSFTGPPSGDWVVVVGVEYSNSEGSGDALFYYRIHAGPPETDMAPGASAPVTAPLAPLAIFGAAVFGAALGWRMRRISPRSAAGEANRQSE